MNSLRQAIQDYLNMRRDLGFKFAKGCCLVKFGEFMRDHNADYVTSELALKWAQQPKNVAPSHWARRLTFVRGFARYRSATNPRTQIPAEGLLPFRSKRAHPYIYSSEEISQLLRAALDMTYFYERGALRPWLYHCLFGLLSVTGMRVGEAINLKVQDVDLDLGVLTIRGAKFGKDRLVPLHTSTVKVIERYLAKRAEHWAGRSVSPYLFVSSQGNRLQVSNTITIFNTLSRQIGLRGPLDKRGPRLHDMRHRFATNTLVRWYQSGQDPARLLPVLSAYLGHVRVEDTQWYLSASPELMREAMLRLERCWEDRT